VEPSEILAEIQAEIKLQPILIILRLSRASPSGFLPIRSIQLKKNHEKKTMILTTGTGHPFPAEEHRQ
jgi:hypothetical protein